MTLQRVQNIKQTIGFPSEENGFSDHFAREIGLVASTTGEGGSGFGMRSDPFTGESRMHQGIDVGAQEGTPIQAVSEGVVSFTGSRGGFDDLAIIDHSNGLQSYYAHQSFMGVTVGDQVAAGTEIGAVGSTGRSTGPHLHFGLRREREPIDPAPYLGGTR